MTADEIHPDQIRDAQLLDELLLAIQAGDTTRSKDLLRDHPELRDWFDCLKSLDSFASPEVAPEFAPSTRCCTGPGLGGTLDAPSLA